MTKIVVYRPEACSPPRGRNSVLKIDDYPWRLSFTPGDNQVSDEDAERLRENSDFERYENHGGLVIKDAPTNPSPSDSSSAPANLSHLNVGEAENLISQTDNLVLLNLWLTAETRITTRADLERRIAALTEA
ncbi:MAG: hypothetical protein AAGJ95_12740 [Cyanobacteria bacterium J06554_11]